MAFDLDDEELKATRAIESNPCNRKNNGHIALERKPKTSKVTLGTLYEVNKNLMKQQPNLSGKQITQKRFEVQKFIEETKNKYYMLLCNDRRDFTIITLTELNKEKSATAAFTVIDECLRNRGQIKSIDKNENGACEMWLLIDEEVYCYYFFPYDAAIVEI